MKVWTYTIIALTVMLMFQFAGFPTGLNPLFTYMGFGIDSTTHGLATADITISPFWDYLFNGLFATVLTILVAVGIVLSGRYDILIAATFACGVLFMFVPSILFPLTYALQNDFPVWITSILALTFGVLTIGYIIALVEYIKGTD
jgi:hypothetical protein